MTALKIGRNDPCPCGSGKKFKQCCSGKTNLTSLKTGSDKHFLSENTQQSLQMAWAYKNRGDLTQAELICRQVIHRIPNHPEALNLLGTLMMQDGRMDEAEKYFRKAIEIKSNNPEFLSNLGLALHEQGFIKDAENAYKKALALAPDYTNAHYNLHALLLKQESLQPAIQCLRKVIALQALDHDARFMLGVLLDYVGQQDEARELFSTVANTSNLMRARLDAWNYLKSSKKIPKITGSGNEIFKLSLAQANAEGLVLEFGVRFGTSIRQIAKMVNQKVHGFDSFQGLPEVWHDNPKGIYSTKGEVPTVPRNVQLHVGWFEDTLPKFLEVNQGPVRFINIDCDIYSATVTILDHLASRIVKGSVIVFDEYICNEHWREDEFKAFQEAVLKYSWEYEYIYFSVFTKQVAVKITKV